MNRAPENAKNFREYNMLYERELLLRVVRAAEPAWLWIRHLEDEGDHTHARLEEELEELKQALKEVEHLLEVVR